MNLDDSELLELNALCNALIDGQITDAERARLEQLLRDSEEARRYYVRALGLSASLMQYAGEMQTEAADAPIVTSRVIRPPSWIWTLSSLAAAAAIVLAFWMGWKQDRNLPGNSRPEIAEAPIENEEGVGRLSGAKDCHWSGAAFQPGDDLHSGQQLKLDSGFAEITFDSGAQVTLEGPAVLDLHSAWEAVLQRGTLKANVPSEAVGFRVTNPSVNVVDLGTEFSMVADETGSTEVFVLKGSVETTALDATGHPARPVVLREKQARRFARAGGDEVRDRELKFEKLMRKIALERFTRPVSYVHWSFDEVTGDLAEASVSGFEAKFEGSDADLAAAHVSGHVGQALNLDGKTIAKASFPGISQRTPRTVAFWVNIPEDASLPDAGAIFAWPLANSGRSVTIGWNRNPTEGVLGALRTDAGRGSVVGSAALRDGHWHHLAVVLSPRTKGEKPDKIDKDGAWLIRQYVDGKLEATSFKHSLKRARGETATEVATNDTLWIGRAVDDSTGEHFRGMIDELFVADAALTPQEIRYLMQKSKPATLEIVAAQ
jgi:ferric-dicitrate binding protein FerR (iron transport regulator)